MIIPYISATATDNPFLYIVAVDGYFEMAVTLVLRTIDIKNSLKHADRMCGATAKNKILSAKIETAIPAEQQAAVHCMMSTDCFGSHCHLAYISVTIRMLISGFHCAAVEAFVLTGYCGA